MFVEIKRPRKGDENISEQMLGNLFQCRNRETPKRGREHFICHYLINEPIFCRNKETSRRGRELRSSHIIPQSNISRNRETPRRGREHSKKRNMILALFSRNRKTPGRGRELSLFDSNPSFALVKIKRLRKGDENPRIYHNNCS